MHHGSRKVAGNRRAGFMRGMTMVELLVALAIGSFLIIGSVQIYNQSRQAYVINDSIAKVQETAQFAMDTIEADLRMASNWGRTSRGLAIDGRSEIGDANPSMIAGIPGACGVEWVLDLGTPVDGDNNAYGLACAAAATPVANADHFVVRRASVAPQAPQAGRVQVQTTRVQGTVFTDGMIPGGFSTAINPITGLPESATHNLLVTSYYVTTDSDLLPGVPTLRRKRLGVNAGAPAIIDEEVAHGVENMQIQFGLDVNGDNTVDRYVNPGDAAYDPAAAGYVPGTRIITARIWLVVRGLAQEQGIEDTRDYEPGDVDLGVYNDNFRRMLVSKTILLRNSRT